MWIQTQVLATQNKEKIYFLEPDQDPVSGSGSEYTDQVESASLIRGIHTVKFLLVFAEQKHAVVTSFSYL